MSNKQIAAFFDQLAKILELHDENPYRIKSFASAYIQLRSLGQEIYKMTPDEISSIKSVGPKIAAMIQEIIATGQLQELDLWISKTPEEIIAMLQIKGIGPKKIKQIWKEMGIETIGELLYACNENRLINYPGFGIKTQEDIKIKLEYYQASKGKYLYGQIAHQAEYCLHLLKGLMPDALLSFNGEFRRKMPIVPGIEIITNQDPRALLEAHKLFTLDDDKVYFEGIPLIVSVVETTLYHKVLFESSCSPAFLSGFSEEALSFGDEAAIFKSKNSLVIPSEFREDLSALSTFNQEGFQLIEPKDIRGIIHNHSTWSDGIHSLEEMATYVQDQGYAYFVITDHSQAAFYANGLKEARVLQQWEAIDRINAQTTAFKVYKGIESDILSDGSLDYPNELLAGFDVIIASVHTVLKMEEEKATSRLIKAIENPYTDILGHPTGRLLLSRPGYPIDHHKVIDACAANDVAIELNANPQRLDIDWSWVPYALEKGVLIAINPDAHSKPAIHNVEFGVIAARKGGLTPENCLNTYDRPLFERWINR
ncbi:MAG: PHP domain-containing protein [Chitinophagales bacterium]|nr:PHP domain-containing protein [Chitinophagales bacterium]